MNGSEVTDLLRQMLVELRAIREALETTDDDYEEDEEGDEDEDFGEEE